LSFSGSQKYILGNTIGDRDIIGLIVKMNHGIHSSRLKGNGFQTAKKEALIWQHHNPNVAKNGRA
jgi:hypothetical protein